MECERGLTNERHRRKTLLTQPAIARVIRAAKKEGAAAVEIQMGEVTFVVRLTPEGLISLAPDQEIVL
jgi:hypothetical protein